MTDSQVNLIVARIDDLRQVVMADTSEIKSHLKTLNGRTRRLEVKVAVQWALWALIGTSATIILTAAAPALLARMFP